MTSALPLTTLLGSADARRAFLCLLVDPRLAGLLVFGPLGCGKSVLVSSFTAFLDEPTLRLPVGTNLDDFAAEWDTLATLRTGRPVRRPDRLDPRTSPWVVAEDIDLLERSMASALARLTDRGGRLLATVTPDPTNVAAELGDRLPFWIRVAPPATALVVPLLRRALEADEGLQALIAGHRSAEAALRASVTRAQARWCSLSVRGDVLDEIDVRVRRFGLEGARPTLHAARAARAHAALAGSHEVGEDDIEFAVRTVLCPRGEPTAEEARDEQGNRRGGEVAATVPSPAKGRSDPRSRESTSVDVSTDGPSRETVESPRDANSAESSGRAGVAQRREQQEIAAPPRLGTRLTLRDVVRRQRSPGSRGRRGPNGPSLRGHGSRSTTDPSKGRRLAVMATLRRALNRYAALGSRPSLPLEFQPDDVCYRRLVARSGRLFLFVIDTSGSMAANRVREAKGAMSEVLRDAYVHRDQVALVTFRGDRATRVLPPTSSAARVSDRLAQLPVGGATPLMSALATSLEVIADVRRRSRTQRRGERAITVLFVTDGRGNVAVTPNDSEMMRRLALAWRLMNVDTVVVDTRSQFDSRTDARDLAERLGARWQRL